MFFALVHQTGDLGDAVVAVLCGDGSDPDVIKAILNRIMRAPAREGADALAQLLVLSKLRGNRPLIERECKIMAITVSVEDIEILRAPIDRALDTGRAQGKAQGVAQGMARAIASFLGKQFPGQVPADLVAQLSPLAIETLEEILDRCWTASSVAEALGGHVPLNRFHPQS